MNISQAVVNFPTGIVDTHCHYNLPPLSEDWQNFWQEAQVAGVKSAWIPGTTLESSREAVRIAQQDDNLFALIGIHPNDEPMAEIEMISTMAELQSLIDVDRAGGRSKIIGIGEIGLDFFRIEKNEQTERDRQWGWLAAQLSLAKRNNLFVSLHVRDQETPELETQGNAYWETVRAVRTAKLSQPFILHCASGPLSYVQAMLDLGAYVSFAGNITYPKADRIREIWQLTPPNRRLLETDAPFLAPQGFRGQLCRPALIAETATWIREHLSPSLG